MMRFKQIALTLVGLLVTGAAWGGARSILAQTPPLTNLGAAPEWASLAWLNSDTPLRVADLRGQVILLEFWTFDCINCIRTVPYVQGWHETYQDQGLVTVGIHYPEFFYEHDLLNVQAAAERLGITYPIGLDNDAATWRAYNQHFWPTIYLIDKAGNLRYFRIGEGNYDRTEQAIQTLLAEDYTPDAALEPAALVSLTPTETLNVRSGAGLDQSIIGSVRSSMSFVVLGEEDGWYQIRYNDGEGYVFGEYVTLSTE
ncbi:MAG: SH3 domain-containing protein [Chloroflexota bacterium]|nr:SH3 domain-containing protein [Chloroflexota bacterium]